MGQPTDPVKSRRAGRLPARHFKAGEQLTNGALVVKQVRWCSGLPVWLQMLWAHHLTAEINIVHGGIRINLGQVTMEWWSGGIPTLWVVVHLARRPCRSDFTFRYDAQHAYLDLGSGRRVHRRIRSKYTAGSVWDYGFPPSPGLPCRYVRARM